MTYSVYFALQFGRLKLAQGAIYHYKISVGKISHKQRKKDSVQKADGNDMLPLKVEN